jgi:hypothetical protein
LTPPETGHGAEAAWEAQWQVWGQVEHLQRHAHTPEQLAFARHVRTWLRNIGPALFACFLDPALPRTNNDLEQFFRQRKGAYRRMTGRRSWNQYIVRYGRFTVFHDPRETPAMLLQRFQHVPYRCFLATRQQWRASLEPCRQYGRFRRDPDAFLARLEEAWPAASG